MKIDAQKNHQKGKKPRKRDMQPFRRRPRPIIRPYGSQSSRLRRTCGHVPVSSRSPPYRSYVRRRHMGQADHYWKWRPGLVSLKRKSNFTAHTGIGNVYSVFISLLLTSLILLSPSGDLGISLVWRNLSGPDRHFSLLLFKSSSNWTKLSMRGPQLLSGWYQMILDVQTRFRLGSD